MQCLGSVECYWNPAVSTEHCCEAPICLACHALESRCKNRFLSPLWLHGLVQWRQRPAGARASPRPSRDLAPPPFALLAALLALPSSLLGPTPSFRTPPKTHHEHRAGQEHSGEGPGGCLRGRPEDLRGGRGVAGRPRPGEVDSASSPASAGLLVACRSPRRPPAVLEGGQALVSRSLQLWTAGVKLAGNCPVGVLALR